MAYLFDTNAVSEVLRRRPNPDYLNWLRTVPAQDQFTSILVVAELLAGAYASPATDKWLERLEQDVFPTLIVLEFDHRCAHTYGKIQAHLRAKGTPIGDTDVQIAATALAFDLTVVTANEKHFERVPGLRLHIFRGGGAPEPSR